jgi:hypothetical protein
MTTSVFVNKTDRIEVTVWYSINTDTGDITIRGINDKPEHEFLSITAKFRKPDFESVQLIIQASTVMDNGVPVVDIIRAGKAILYQLIDSWDIKDEEGKTVPCTLQSVNSLHPAIGNALSTGIQSKMGDLSQMFT